MLRRSALPALGLVVAGCGLVGPPATGPDGLTSYDADLRSLTASGRFEQALTLAEEDGGDAGDDLLAELNRAIVEHYAGRYEESNARLQAAEREIDERFTKSVSRAAASLVTSDRALQWLPSRSERPMIHVYGALNYLALGEADEAAVEARRMSAVLDEMIAEEGVDGLDPEARQLHRALRYFAASVFEQAGERNDADVAFRLAGFDEAADGFASVSTGSVVVLVESGFVAHRIERSVVLPVFGDDLDPMRYGSDADRRRHARCFSHERFAATLESWGEVSDVDCRPTYDRDDDGDGWVRDRRARKESSRERDRDITYLMRVSWPTMIRPPASAPLSTVRAFSAGTTPAPRLEASRDATALAEADEASTTPSRPGGGLPGADGPVVAGDLSGAVTRDFNRAAPGILVKAIARAALKYAVVEAVEDGIREEDDTLADIAAVVGNVFAAATERADTRSWAMLPSQLSVVRLDLEPGRHDIVIEGDPGFGRQGPFSSRPSRSYDLGEVDVRPGRVTVLSVRAWP